MEAGVDTPASFVEYYIMPRAVLQVEIDYDPDPPCMMSR